MALNADSKRRLSGSEEQLQLLLGPQFLHLLGLTIIIFSRDPYNPDKAKALNEANLSNKKLTFYVTQGGSGMLDPVAMDYCNSGRP